jgi:hypothetical protein
MIDSGAVNSVRVGDADLLVGWDHHVCRVGGLELPGQFVLLRHLTMQGFPIFL